MGSTVSVGCFITGQVRVPQVLVVVMGYFRLGLR